MRNLVAVILLTQASIAFSFENLQNGIGITEEVDSAIRNTSIPYAVARQGQRTADNNELVKAFIEVGDAVFSLSSIPDLIKTNISNRELLGHWPLGTTEICDVSKGCKSTWWQGRWREEELLEAMSIDRLENLYGGLAFADAYAADGYRQSLDIMGCMQHKPLRYGDIDGDGKPELVIMLAQRYSIDWIIFSPAMGKTVFAIKPDINDAVSHNNVEQILIPSSTSAKLYQYWMESERDKATPLYYPALKSYAKLYFGDFDADGAYDILVWRKAYDSRLVSDAISGFELKSELYAHYKKVNGEYRLQTTDAETIQQWLADKTLTWQKGYPSKSECAGQEGQLIPEMHDPLLNDPEVMQ